MWRHQVRGVPAGEKQAQAGGARPWSRGSLSKNCDLRTGRVPGRGTEVPEGRAQGRSHGRDEGLSWGLRVAVTQPPRLTTCRPSWEGLSRSHLPGREGPGRDRSMRTGKEI